MRTSRLRTGALSTRSNREASRALEWACSLPLVRDRLIGVVCHIQFSRGHVYFTFLCYAAHGPLQFVFAIQLVRTLECLPEHSHLRCAVSIKLRCHLDRFGGLSSAWGVNAFYLSARHLPLANDQALRTRAAS